MMNSESIPTNDKNQGKSESADVAETNSIRDIAVGRMVEVARRMWPGINRPGGAARITFVHYDGENNSDANQADTENETRLQIPSHVNVVYIIEGGTESRVPIEYVKAAPELDFHGTQSINDAMAGDAAQNPKVEKLNRRKLRNRGLLLGRCKRCGSLRMDCGSCDMLFMNQSKNVQPSKSIKRSKSQRVAKQNSASNDYDTQNQRQIRHESSSSEDTDDLFEKIQTSHQQYRRSRSRNKSKLHISSKKGQTKSKTTFDQPHLKQNHRRRYIHISSSSSSSSNDSYNGSYNESETDDDLILSNLFFKDDNKNSKMAHQSSPNQHASNNSYEFTTTIDPLQSLGVFSHEKQPAPRFSTNVSTSSSSTEDEGSLTSKPDTIASKIDEDLLEPIDSQDQSKDSPLQNVEKSSHKKNQSKRNRKKRRKKQNRTSLQVPVKTATKKALKDYIDPLTDANDAFIQPEGVDAAENLPEGQNDVTVFKSYQELPSYFDETADLIQNDTLPDAECRLFILKRKISTTKANKSLQTLSEHDENVTKEQLQQYEQSLQDFERESDDLYKELCGTLIRNGLDQCRKCLKRIQDEYHQHKKRLTKEEKKQFRGIQMETRDFRLQRLEDEVEKMMKEIRLMMESFMASAGNNEVEDQDNSEGSGEDSMEISTENNESENEFQCRANEDIFIDTSLLPFDPHQHATKVRIQKRPSDNYQGTKERSLISKHNKNSKNLSKIARKRKRSYAAAKYKSRQNKIKITSTESNGIVQEHTHSFKKDSFIHRDGNEAEVINLPLAHSESTNIEKSSKTSPESIHQVEVDSSMNVSDVGIDKSEDDANSISDSSDEPNVHFDTSLTSKNHKQTNLLSRSSKIFQNYRSKDVLIQDDVVEEKKNHQKSATSNMEQFLRANSVDIERDDTSFNAIPADLLKKTDQNEALHDSEFNFARRRQNNSQNLPERTFFPSLSELYQSLEKSLTSEEINNDQKHNTDLLPPVRSISEHCKIIIEYYPTNESLCIETFQWINHYFKQDYTGVNETILRRHVKAIFEMILTTLRRHGTFTLLEFIRCKPSQFILHAKLLISTFFLLEKKINEYLSPEDEVFGFFKKSLKCFTDAIILQIIDVIYSQILLNEWGEPNPIPKEFLDVLNELSDAISRTNPILETVSRLILNELKCQKWRKHESGPSKTYIWFISSIDPKSFKKFLMGGNESPNLTQENDRFKKFKTSIPRKEIEAVWAMLAYFGRMKYIPHNEGYLWRLVISLFLSTAGVLGGKDLPKSLPLPPCENQLTCCAKEIKYFTILLKSCNSIPIPANDLILEKLLKKSIGLVADSLRYDYHTRSLFFKNYQDKVDLRIIRTLWEASDLFEHENTQLIEKHLPSEISGELSGLYELASNETILSLAPSLGILRSCVSLCLTWNSGCVKKARKIRFERTILGIIKHFTLESSTLEQGAQTYEENKIQNFNKNKPLDIFAESFSSQLDSKTGKKCGCIAAGCLYRESAGFFFLTTRIMSGKTNYETSYKSSTDLEFYEKLWTLIATKDMLNVQICYYNERSLNATSIGCVHLPGPSLLAAAKLVLCSLKLFLNEEQIQDELLSSSQGLNACVSSDGTKMCILKFLVSCMATCLRSSCSLLKQSRNVAASTDSYVNPNSIICVRIITRICCLFSEMLNSIRKKAKFLRKNVFLSSTKQFTIYLLSLSAGILTECLDSLTETTDQGYSGDVCFRSILALIRTNIFFIHNLGLDELGRRAENSNNNLGADPFGGIDDDVFLNMDIDLLISKKNDNTIVEAKEQNDITSRSCQSFEERIDIIMKGDLWRLLLSILSNSIPSMRYSIENKKLPLNTKLCGRQAGGICATLAAMCTLRRAIDVNFLETLKIMFCPYELKQVDLNDRLFCKSLGRIFCAEICNLAKAYKECKTIVQINFKEIFGCFLEALLDSSVINRFPTSNFKLVQDKGGKLSIYKKILEKVSRAVEPVKDFNFKLNDNEAGGLARRKDETFDSPEYYLCKNLWKFSGDLGRQMENFFDGDIDLDPFKSIGKVLIGSDLGPSDMQKISSFVLNIKATSLERECFKRLMKLLGILTVMGRHNFFQKNSHHELTTKWRKIIEESTVQIIKSLLEQMYFIDDTVQYYDHISGGMHDETRENHVNSHKRLKAYALQQAYVKLACGSLTLFIRCYEYSSNPLFDGYVNFIKDKIISPVLLKQKDFDLQTSMRNAASPSNENSPYIPFDICLKTKRVNCSKRSVSNNFDSGLNLHLHHTLCYRVRDLVVHVACTTEKGIMYNAIMEVGMHSIRSEHDDYVALLVGYALRSLEPIEDSNCLHSLNQYHLSDAHQMAIGGYYNIVDKNIPTSEEKTRRLGSLRRFALQKYFLPRLQSTKIGISNHTKVGILKVLIGILGNFQNDVTSKESLYLISTTRDEVENDPDGENVFLNLNDICAICRSCMQCLRNEMRMILIEDRIFECCFSLSQLLLMLPISELDLCESKSMHNWINSFHLCESGSNENAISHKSYIKVFFQWMRQLGEAVIENEFASLFQTVKRFHGDTDNSIWNDECIKAEISKLRSKNNSSMTVAFLLKSQKALNIEKKLLPYQRNNFVQNKYSKKGAFESSNRNEAGNESKGKEFYSLNAKAKLAAAKFVHSFDSVK